MTKCPITPPPHLLKKFSTEARDESNKRNGTGYLKTFARLCIEWAMNFHPTSNLNQIRSSEIIPPPELLREWCAHNSEHENYEQFWHYIAAQAAQWGADQELEACCEWLHEELKLTVLTLDVGLRAARRPKPVAPTDEEIEEWADAATEVPLEEMDPDVHGWRRCFTAKEFSETIRAALTCWGTPAIPPVPVNERLPGPDDCDKQGHVWAWRVYRYQDEDDDDGDFWMQIPAKWLSHIPFSSSWSHWLPANALPTPEAAND